MYFILQFIIALKSVTQYKTFYITEYEKIIIARQTDQLKREPNLQPWQSEPDFLLVSILLDIIPMLQLHFMS